MSTLDSLFGPPPGAQEPELPVEEKPSTEQVASPEPDTSIDALFGPMPVPVGGEPEKPQQGDFKEHVRHSPSSAPRWTRCPGSIIATDGLTSKAGAAADEGTAAHWMLEQCLLQGKTTDELSAEYPTIQGQDRSWPSQGEMAETLRPLVDEYLAEAKKRGTILIPERKLFCHESLGLPEPVGGTADITIFKARARTLGVEDLKYGKNVIVKASELDAEGKPRPNEQLMTYLLCAYYDWLENHSKESKSPVEKLYICIRQPRAKKKRDRKSVFECTVEQLLEWAEWYKAKFYATLEPDAPRIPGEKQCTFCMAKNKPDRCPEYATQGAKEAERFLATVKEHMPEGMSTEDLFARDPSTMTLVELNAARLLAEDYERQAKAIKKEAEERLHSGQKLNNWKLVHGNSTRYFNDGMKAMKVAEELVAGGLDRSLLFEPPKPEGLLSVAQIEKNLDDAVYSEHFGPLVGTLAGKATVAPANSRKADYDPSLVGSNASGEWTAEENPNA